MVNRDWDSESLLSSHRKRPSGTDFLIFISEENLIVIGCYFSHNKAGKLISSRFSGFLGIMNFVIIDKAIQVVFEIWKPRTAYRYIERTVRTVLSEPSERGTVRTSIKLKSTKPSEQLLSWFATIFFISTQIREFKLFFKFISVNDPLAVLISVSCQSLRL